MWLKLVFVAMTAFYGLNAAGQTGARHCCMPRIDSLLQPALLHVEPKTPSTYIVDGILLAPGGGGCPGLLLSGPGAWFRDRQFGAYTLTAEIIERLPIFDLNDQLSMLPGFYQRRAGGELNVMGARPDGNLYIVDGIQIQ